ncbi:MAG: CvpA family protein [Sedimentisphaerales bacterium]|nr:CvpA family protein [Sedimentisphaerales bacterium]
MTVLIVLLIIVGFILYQALKDTLARSIVTVFAIILAAVVSFAFFEQTADLIISRTTDSSRKALVDFAQPLSFILLFVIAFSVFQFLSMYLLKKHIELSPLAEKIGKVVFAAISGLIFAGIILTFTDLAPISRKITYQRFDKTNPNPDYPKKAFLNADVFATGLFCNLSSGSLSGKKSFAVVHPSLIDETFLNFLAKEKNFDILTSKPAIQVPQKNAAWFASDQLKDTNGNNITPQYGHELVIARIGIKRYGSPFSLSQLRLICNEKTAENPLKGIGINAYPIGYIKGNRVEKKNLSDVITVEPTDFTDGVRWFDFVFNVPNNYVPVLVAFKQNSIVAVPKLASEAPATTTTQINVTVIEVPKDSNSP